MFLPCHGTMVISACNHGDASMLQCPTTSQRSAFVQINIRIRLNNEFNEYVLSIRKVCFYTVN